MDVQSKEYREHRIFTELDEYQEFYKGISYTIMSFVTMGTKSIINIDTYSFSSMQGTIDSIKMTLANGRINDAYALLRKYYDSTIINIYASLYLQNEVSLENFIVKKIDNWLNGIEAIPEYRIMSSYIRNSEKFTELNKLLHKDERYKRIRKRCNDHTHYNFYHNVLLNDNEIYLPYRIKALSQYQNDIKNIFILHLAYLFYLNEHYMASTDYIDALDCGLTPEENSQYWVSPFIQEIFDKVIKTNRPDIANLIIEKTCMSLK